MAKTVKIGEIEALDVQIGAVEIKNAADDTRAKVGATGALAEGDNALAVQAPVLGATTGAAVVTDAVGTLQQYLRGLVKWAFERMPASLGQGTMAQSLPVVVASNQTAVSVSGPLTDAELRAAAVPISIDQTTPGTTNGVQVNAALPAGSNTIGAMTDAGPQQTVTRTYTASADMTTAADITPAPTAGQKIVAMDVLVSTDTAMSFSIQEETSATVFAKVFLPANGSAQITLRGYIKAAVANKKLQGKASVAGNVAITTVTFSEA